MILTLVRVLYCRRQIAVVTQATELSNSTLNKRCDAAELRAESNLRGETSRIEREMDKGMSELRNKAVSLEGSILSTDTKLTKRASGLENGLQVLESKAATLDTAMQKQKAACDALVEREVLTLSSRVEGLEAHVEKKLSGSLLTLERKVESGLGPVVAKANTLETKLGLVEEVAKEGSNLGGQAVMSMKLMKMEIDEAKQAVVTLNEDIHGDDENGVHSEIMKQREQLMGLETQLKELAVELSTVEMAVQMGP